MSMGDPPPPRGMIWTDAAGWQPMTSGDWTLEEAMRAHYPPYRLAKKPTPEQLRCAGADAYDGIEPPTCDPPCEACIMKWCGP